MNLFYLITATLLINSKALIEPCQSINFGLQSEKVLTYSIHDSDPILDWTTVIYFNELGYTLKAVSFSESNPDTSFTIMEYDNNKIIRWKDFISGHNDTIVFQAVDWNQQGRGTKFIKQGEEGSYSIFKYKNCVTINKKTFSRNELIYSINYQWDDNLVKKSTCHFYGSFQQAIEQSVSTTESNFESFDEKGNWTKRTFIKDKKKFMELRLLSYY